MVYNGLIINGILMEYNIINHECIKWVMMGYNLMLYHGNIMGISWNHRGFFR